MAVEVLAKFDELPDNVTKPELEEFVDKFFGKEGKEFEPWSPPDFIDRSVLYSFIIHIHSHPYAYCSQNVVPWAAFMRTEIRIDTHPCVMVTMLNGTLALLCTKQLCVKLRIDISAVTAVFLIPCCSGSGDLLGVRESGVVEFTSWLTGILLGGQVQIIGLNDLPVTIDYRFES